MKVLIIRFSSIGDIVLTTPVIRALKTQLDNAEVHYVTKKQYHGVLKENPYIDKIHLLDGKLSSLVKELKKEKFDYIIDLHKNLRTSLIKLQLWGVKSYSFNKINREKWLYVNWKLKNVMPNVHIVDRYMEPATKLGVKTDALGLDYFIAQEDEVELSWIGEDYTGEYAGFVIGGQHATKQLPFEKMIELMDRITIPTIILGGPEDKEVGDKLVEYYEKNFPEKKVFNSCGKFKLNQSASLVKQAKVIFTHDTGLMHIAAAFKKQVYSIWGNTTPELGMYPYRTSFVVYERKDLDCRPCSKIGHKECPKGHFKCMREQEFDFEV
ncbi:glycosyltransferase family 9 protein [Sediminitomix flava]|uniref:ADP-heptose:LPS heptosyltransferase n=1 Tax=Sediminitomix flava TaxID=379075 RepID=A0A315Z8E7_SEDFL|nr:glycosyltransferase family 9 protein [Sediminitomix flava]PWJ39306.1 ADP-heptose:LPS heptosyltransferase [Sediminitomix flava]